MNMLAPLPLSASIDVPAPIARFFPGMSEDEVAERYPMVALDAEGMAPPGPDFIAEAVYLGDTVPGNEWRKPSLVDFVAAHSADSDIAELKNKTKSELLEIARGLALPGSWLEVLHRAALYQSPFYLNIVTGTETISTRFLPGHIWGKRKADGPAPADVLVIGKHPSSDELRWEKNFSGDAIQLLIRAFKELGVDSTVCDSWYVTNIVKHSAAAKPKDALPASWIKNCLPLFHQELRLVRPKWILCLGADATKAVLGRSLKMTDTIGQIYETAVPELPYAQQRPESYTAKVVCCTHPAKVLREPELYDKPEFLGSLRLFVGLCQGTHIDNEEASLERRYITSLPELKQLVDAVIAETPNGASIALDCEWHGAYPWDKGAYLRTVQFSHKPFFGAALIINRPGGIRNADIGTDVEWIVELGRLTQTTKERPVRLIGHNLKADLPWLKHYGLDLTEQFNAPANTDSAFGWARTKIEGGFDTMLAAHAHNELGPFKLEILAAQHLGTPRYDAPVIKWRKEYCDSKGIKEGELEGYGDMPEEILLPYSTYDPDVTRRLFEVYNGADDKVGLLDCDRFGNCCREAFWRSQRATLAAMEIETVGIPVDRELADTLIDAFSVARSRLLQQLRDKLNWCDFNPESNYHRLEFLFGEDFAKKDKKGNPVRVRPPEAKSLYLQPVATTKGRPWSEAGPKDNPSADGTTTSILAVDNPDVRLYRDLRFTSQTLKTVLRPPTTMTDEETGETEDVYEKGTLSYLGADNRLRTNIFPIETGRWSSSRPNLMNLSNKRDEDYRRILEGNFKPLRNILKAPPGCLLVEADYTGAELAVTGWLSRERNLIEHCARMLLPEDHPDFYDIHANIAVKSFGLKCAPTKKGLKVAGFSHLRIAAKRRIFGFFYGQGDAAALLQIHEEGAMSVTLDDVRRTTAGIHQMYPLLDQFFEGMARRVSIPGWICNPMGRYRRFRETTDRKRLGDLERQAKNFDIQSTVGDATSTALDNLRTWRSNNPQVKFDILLQIHDAILLAVPYEHVAQVVEDVLPTCMSKNVPICPCDPDGMPLPGEPIRHLGIDTKVGVRWGESLTKTQAREFKIPDRLAKE